MQNLLNTLNDSITSLIDTVNATAKALYDNANQRKQDYIDALVALDESAGYLFDMSEALDRLDEVVRVGAVCEDAGNHICDMIEDVPYFEAPVEEFDGYCDRCGKEILRDEPTYTEDDMIICGECKADIDEVNAPLNPADSPCADD